MAFGQSSDMKRIRADRAADRIADNWEPYYIERVQAVMDGTWASKDTWGGIGPGMVELSPFSDRIPEAVRAEAQAAARRHRRGHAPPLHRPDQQAGRRPWLADGATPSTRSCSA